MAKDFRLISREIFYGLTAALLIFIILESLWPNIVLAYFNLNYLFLLWFLSGLGFLAKSQK